MGGTAEPWDPVFEIINPLSSARSLVVEIADSVLQSYDLDFEDIDLVSQPADLLLEVQDHIVLLLSWRTVSVKPERSLRGRTY